MGNKPQKPEPTDKTTTVISKSDDFVHVIGPSDLVNAKDIKGYVLLKGIKPGAPKPTPTDVPPEKPQPKPIDINSAASLKEKTTHAQEAAQAKARQQFLRAFNRGKVSEKGLFGHDNEVRRAHGHPKPQDHPLHVVTSGRKASHR